MTLEIVATVVAGALLALAAFGTVYPVLPGSLLAIVTLPVWAWVMGSSAAWVAALAGAVMATAGWSAGAVLTGRTLRRLRIPRGSIAVAVAAAVVGMFLIPFAGLFVGFAAGLLAGEYARRRDARAAVAAAAEALRATGVGILLEFGMVCLAGSAWTIGVIVHFAGR